MTDTADSMAKRFRALKSKGLDFDSYAGELAALADLSDRDVEAHESELERLLSLRRRLRALESKVHEMESVK